MSISDRTSNRTRPESLRRLLAEHEPESLRTFRRRWRFLVRIAAPGWVLLAAAWLVPGAAPWLASNLSGAIELLTGVVAWLTVELVLTMAIWDRAALVLARVMGTGFGVIPYGLGASIAAAETSQYHAGVGLQLLLVAPLVAIASIVVTVVVPVPSLGSSDRDATVELVSEALGWLVFWTDGKWGLSQQRTLRELLRDSPISGPIWTILGPKLDAKFWRLTPADTPGPAQSARRVARRFLLAARGSGINEPEISLMILLFEALLALGAPTTGQTEYLKALGRSFRLDDDFVAARIAIARELAGPMSREEAAKILGVSPHAPRAEVEAAFHRALDRVGQESRPVLAKAKKVLTSGRRRVL